MSESAYDLLSSVERSMRHAELFTNVTWLAHLDTLQVGQLPHFKEKLREVNAALEEWADAPDEMERLHLMKAVLTREIAYLEKVR